MSDFEFVFALYSLLLGLSLVELLTGFGKALEVRLTAARGSPEFRIGWLTPLLGLFVLLDLLTFWTFAWTVRDHIAVSTRSLLFVMAFASAYFMAARLVFPGQVTATSDLDGHYLAVRRTVLGILFVLVFVQWGFLSTIPAMWPLLSRPLTLVTTAILLALMAATMIVRGRKASLVLLGLLVMRYLMLFLYR